MPALAENRYGKSRVRLLRVRRYPDRHELRDWTVQILLRGDFASCFERGDNSKILPTDTMKNTVYSLARESSADCIEDFARELIDFLLPRNPQVSEVEVTVHEKSWDRLLAQGKPHATAFAQSGAELQTTTASRAQSGKLSIVSGLENLAILKTSGSAFTGYIKDSLTTLPETTDRLFGTALAASWSYNESASSFPALRSKVRAILLSTFADHRSESVQHTLYAMAGAALDAVPQIDDVRLTMPNKHCLLVDLSRFGQDNPNEIFVPTDEPHGYIEARVARSASAAG